MCAPIHRYDANAYQFAKARPRPILIRHGCLLFLAGHRRVRSGNESLVKRLRQRQTDIESFSLFLSITNSSTRIAHKKVILVVDLTTMDCGGITDDVIAC